MNPHPYRHASLWQSLSCAWKGLRWAVHTQRNVRAQLLVAAAALSLGLYVQLDGVRLSILFLTIVLVLALELLNTALEALVDVLFPVFHAAAAAVKDVAAGATLLAALGAILVGLSLLWDVWETAWPEVALRGGLTGLVLAFAGLGLPRAGR